MELLDKHGHKAIAFARKHCEHISSEYEDFFPEDIKTDSIHFPWEALRTLKEIFYSGEAKHALYELLKKFHPDLVHAHKLCGNLTASMLDLLHERRGPVVTALHEWGEICL